MRKSTDQGATFGDPVTVTGLKSGSYGGDLLLTDSGGQPFTTNAFPQAAVNPVTGDIYVAFADQAKGSADKANISFTQSTDGGRKWSKPVQINDDLTNNDQWFPALAVTPDGSHVGLFWYDRRLDPANNLIDRFGAIGAVDGHTVTFGANFRITDVSFPPAFTYWAGTEWHIQDPALRPGYMGDYDQAVADNDNFYTTWSDNRLANAFHANQPDVRLAKVPVELQGTNASLLVSGGVVAAASSTATMDYPAMAAAEMYAFKTLPTRVVVGQEAASRSGGDPNSSSAFVDVVQLAPVDLPILNSEKERLQIRSRGREQLVVDGVFQALDTDLLVEGLVSALVT
jgi:hypothetical protein